MKEIDKNHRILIEWNGPGDPSLVEWVFEARGESTFVIVNNWGFGGDAKQIVAQAIDSTGGVTFLLAALRVFLEHGIEPNFVVDHDPDALVEGWARSQAEQELRTRCTSGR